jgi:plastocyanin
MARRPALPPVQVLRMTSSWGLLPLLSAASLAHAAVVTVQVTDAAGEALPGAVVMVEPVDARLPVKPLRDVQISQARRQFHPSVTVVTVGTPVSFPNYDTVRHHVYSFSPAKSFELKLYAGVPGTPVVFDKPGVAVLGCNIHDNMVAWVVVVDTPLYAVSGNDGHVTIPAVAPGSYRLHVWHAGLPPSAPDGSIAPLQVAADDIDRKVRLELAPHTP